MTSPTRTPIVLFNAQVTPGATTKKTADAAADAANGNGGWIDVRGYNGGVIGVIITNGASAPGAPLKYTIQASDVSTGANITELRNGAGDTASAAAGYPISAAVPLRAEFSYVRVLGYNNTTSAVGLKAVAFLKA